MVLPISKLQLEQGMLRARNMSTNFTTGYQYKTFINYVSLLIHAVTSKPPISILDTDQYYLDLEKILATAESRFNAIDNHK